MNGTPTYTDPKNFDKDGHVTRWTLALMASDEICSKDSPVKGHFDQCLRCTVIFMTYSRGYGKPADPRLLSGLPH